ncbi:hypothetical protein [Microvirga zambiensis]|uniref:hypothetical protein n=1 Tax=Microvirga zambiensis TaxID=1402137 RepID=UPI00191D83F0|nr:hypothetical protein [Microvirga zambiensis]
MNRPEAIEAIVLATSTNETKAKGRVRKVTFEIPAEGANPFEGLGGERIHIVVVRLNNDETPVEEPKQIAVPEGQPWDAKPLPKQAAIRGQDPEFRRFLGEKICAPRGWEAPSDDQEAAQVIRTVCNIGSRAELSINPYAAEKWRGLDADFWAWQRGAR